jgi:hypothetical protein
MQNIPVKVAVLCCAPQAGGASNVAVTEDTKRKVDAAKSYIENMYRVQYQNIQERYARWVALAVLWA